MSNSDVMPQALPPEPPEALKIPGLPPLPVALERRTVKPSGYRLMVRVQLPGHSRG